MRKTWRISKDDLVVVALVVSVFLVAWAVMTISNVLAIAAVLVLLVATVLAVPALLVAGVLAGSKKRGNKEAVKA